MFRKQLTIATLVAMLFALMVVPPRTISASKNIVPQQHGKIIAGIVEDFEHGRSELVYQVADGFGARTRISPTAEQLKTLDLQPQAALGNKRAAIILARMDGGQDPLVDVPTVQDMFFNLGRPDSVANRVKEASYNLASLSGDVYGPVAVTSPPNSSGCERVLASVELARQAAGVSGYDYYFIVVAPQSGCPYAGYSDIIGTHAALFGTFDPRSAFHEFGHLIGLSHSAYLGNYPANPTIDPSACTTPDNSILCQYGDYADVLGAGSKGYHAFNRVKTGWIPPTDCIVMNAAQSDRVITIASVDQTSGVRDVEIPLSGSGGWSYHLELSANPALTGLTLRLDRPNTKNAQGADIGSFMSFLVSMTGDHNDPAHALLAQGQTYQDLVHGITIVALSVTDTSATVRVVIPSGPMPQIDEVAAGGKKLVVWGANFGSGAHVLVNGIDVSVIPGINVAKAKNAVIKLKASSASLYPFQPGRNTIQVMTADGQIVSAAFGFSL